MIELNPFTSTPFMEVWCKHFNTNQTTYSFSPIKGLHFFKFKGPLFINIGKNLTKGITYQIEQTHENRINDKVCLIYDVPAYAQSEMTYNLKGIGIKKIKQYPGFLIHLNQYTNCEDYLKKTFSKSSLQKLRRYNKRLHTCFDINEKMLLGASVDQLEYNSIFDHFHQLLTKRFEDKQITNNNLNPAEWRFYQDVAYSLILQNKAALHVIYNKNTPISIRLLYFSKHIIFDAITVFDIDYAKFHIGKLSIMKMLQWSFESNYKVFDFSKGYFDYKESWSDFKYNFEYHIIYNPKSVKSTWIAGLVALSFKIKQYLRDRNINNLLHKASFLLKQSPKTKEREVTIIEDNNLEINDSYLKPIDVNSDIDFLKKYIIEFQFLNSEHQKNIRLYQILNNKGHYLIKGRNSHQLIDIGR